MNMYLQDYDGWFLRRNNTDKHQLWAGNEINNLWGSRWGSDSNPKAAHGGGMTIHLGYLPNTDSFYCPSNTYVNSYWDHGPRAARSKWGTAWGDVRCDYALNSVIMAFVDGNYRLGNRPTYPIWADVFVQGTNGGIEANFHRPHRDEGLVVAYIDGSVKWLAFDRLALTSDQYFYGTLWYDGYCIRQTWLKLQSLHGK